MSYNTGQTVSSYFKALEKLPKNIHLMDKLKGNEEPLVLAGDGKHDSMGHSIVLTQYFVAQNLL